MKFKNKSMSKTILSLILFWTIFLFSLEKTAFAEESQNKLRGIKKITILHTNDMHGRILEEKDSGIGFAKLNTKIKDMIKKNPNTILLDSGDAVQGSKIATISKGESIIKLMNVMEYDAMALGNHEFDYGYERLLELKDMADFPIISGNISNKYGKMDFKPYIIKEVDGIKIGIFSVITPDTEYATSPKNIDGITFLNPIIASREIIKELEKKEVDMVIGLTHLGTNKKGNFSSIHIAENVEGIDIIVDGHSHMKLDKGTRVGKTLIIESGKHAENLGVVEIKFLGNRIISKKARIFTKEEGRILEEDKELKKLIDEMIEENENKIKETSSKSKGKIHIVRSGDVLFRIGEKYNIDWSELARVNKIKNPNKIYPGDKIKIPRH